MNLTLTNSQVRQFYHLNMAHQVESFNSAMQSGQTTKAQVQLLAFNNAFANLRAAFPNATQDIIRIEQLQSQLTSRVTQLDQIQAANLHPNEMTEARPAGIRRPGSNMNCGFNSVFQCMMNTVSIPKTISSGNGKAARTLNPLAQSYTHAQARGHSVAEGVDAQQIRLLASPDVSSSPRVQEDAFDIWQSVSKQLGVQPTFDQTYTDFEGDGKSSSREFDEPGIRLSLTHKPQKFEELMEGYFDEFTDRGVIHRSFKETPDTLVVQADRTFWTAQNGQHNLNTPILDVPDTYTVPQESTPPTEGRVDYQIKGCVIQHGSLNAGHFISLQKKPDGWYVVDDDVVRKVSNREAQRLLSKGYLFFYEKVGVQAEKPPRQPETVAAKTSYWTKGFPMTSTPPAWSQNVAATIMSIGATLVSALA